MIKPLIFLSAVCLFFSLEGKAQLKNVQVKDLSFMSGTWVQKNDWGDLEEFWSQPDGESMMSSFRCVKDGQAVFYEFVTIEMEHDLPVMKMRHFKRGNIAWEDKDKPLVFLMTDQKDQYVRFQSQDGETTLSYERIAKNKLQVILEEKAKSGKEKKEVFDYTLK